MMTIITICSRFDSNTLWNIAKKTKDEAKFEFCIKAVVHSFQVYSIYLLISGYEANWDRGTSSKRNSIFLSPRFLSFFFKKYIFQAFNFLSDTWRLSCNPILPDCLASVFFFWELFARLFLWEEKVDSSR